MRPVPVRPRQAQAGRQASWPVSCSAMNDSLKKFCFQSQFISLTLDMWSDRRLRTFFAMTGMIENFLEYFDYRRKFIMIMKLILF